MALVSGFQRASVGILLSVLGFAGSESLAAPCLPNDPLGKNPGNLCLVFPPGGINANSFIQGESIQSYYGIPPSFDQNAFRRAGQPIGNIQVIDPPRLSGYWSSVKASNASTTIINSNGKQYHYTPKTIR